MEIEGSHKGVVLAINVLSVGHILGRNTARAATVSHSEGSCLIGLLNASTSDAPRVISHVFSSGVFGALHSKVKVMCSYLNVKMPRISSRLWPTTSFPHASMTLHVDPSVDSYQHSPLFYTFQRCWRMVRGNPSQRHE